MSEAWWRFFGDLFAMTSSRIDFDDDSEHPPVTSNRWYRWAFLKMITPSEYMEVYLQANKPANDNDASPWWTS